MTGLGLKLFTGSYVAFLGTESRKRASGYKWGFVAVQAGWCVHGCGCFWMVTWPVVMGWGRGYSGRNWNQEQHTLLLDSGVQAAFSLMEHHRAFLPHFNLETIELSYLFFTPETLRTLRPAARPHFLFTGVIWLLFACLQCIGKQLEVVVNEQPCRRLVRLWRCGWDVLHAPV